MVQDTERADKEAPREPWLLEFRSSNGFILATVCVAIFTVRYPRKAILDPRADFALQDAFLYGVVSV